MQVEDAVQEARFEETKSNLRQYSHITEFLRMYTSEAAKLVPDNSLDYIYVDARHDYCGVREDLRTWWPKLRMGGIFAGHDYLSGAEALKLGHTWRQCMDGEWPFTIQPVGMLVVWRRCGRIGGKRIGQGSRERVRVRQPAGAVHPR